MKWGWHYDIDCHYSEIFCNFRKEHVMTRLGQNFIDSASIKKKTISFSSTRVLRKHESEKGKKEKTLHI